MITELAFVYEKLRDVENPVLLDCGAFRGMFSLLGLFITGYTYYGFEPHPLSFKRAQENVTLNMLKRTHLYNVALLDKPGTGILKSPLQSRPGKLGLSTLGTPKRFTAREQNEVDVTTLDTFMVQEKLEKVDFIKIDVEGAELLVLEGGKELIEAFHPPMLIEIKKRNLQQFGCFIHQIYNFLSDFGYEHIEAQTGRDEYFEIRTDA